MRTTLIAAALSFALVVAARLIMEPPPSSVPPQDGAVNLVGPDTNDPSPPPDPEGEPACNPTVETAALLESAARVERIRSLLEHLEPSVATSAPTVAPDALQQAARAIGNTKWVDCDASPCVAGFEGGSAQELAAALRTQRGFENAHIITWSAKGTVQLAVWPEPPPEAIEAVGLERFSSVYAKQRSNQ